MQRTKYKKLLSLLEEYLKLGCNINYFLCGSTKKYMFVLLRPNGTLITEGNTMETLLINIGKLK